MKDKFLHNSFFNYVRAMRLSAPNTRGKGMLEPFLIIISALFMFWFLSAMDIDYYDAPHSDFIIGGVTNGVAVGAIMYAGSLLLGFTRRKKPSTLNLMPVCWKKRAVYSYLHDVLTFIFVCIVILVCFAVFIFLFSVLVLMSTGVWIWEYTFDVSLSEEVLPYGKGQLLCWCVFFLTFGTAKCISCLKNKKLRYALLVGYPVVFRLLTLLMFNLAAPSEYLVESLNLSFAVNDLPCPVAWVTVIALITAAVCGLSVYLTIKWERPKNF